VTPPISIDTLFGTWLTGVESYTTGHIRIGICALLWAIWNCRNDIIFNRKNLSIFCRLFTETLLRSVRGCYSLMRTPGSFWL
uniref:Uncharacterized protein n=1 Tax=Aegilops tauschii subsp. strangulata TaxID=200361 RepID=A0A452ZM05_AEGTS